MTKQTMLLFLAGLMYAQAPPPQKPPEFSALTQHELDVFQKTEAQITAADAQLKLAETMKAEAEALKQAAAEEQNKMVYETCKRIGVPEEKITARECAINDKFKDNAGNLIGRVQWNKPQAPPQQATEKNKEGEKK